MGTLSRLVAPSLKVMLPVAEEGEIVAVMVTAELKEEGFWEEVRVVVEALPAGGSTHAAA
jgi:hypothetical protein